ncbi:hypothetical protein [Megasphaera stantonii]|uniref:hypothetical protein n=1 Tax=Megasphaera stantonii TaxID=2144175 RepID=UPI000D1654F8|nr:hypothetical protein [Megasphaera stantonii]
MYSGGASLSWAADGMLATNHYLAEYGSCIAVYPSEVKAALLVVTLAGGFIWKHVHNRQDAAAA